MKKTERKSDELLAYLHHARNVGEHTIRAASTKAVFAVSGSIQSEGGFLGISFDENGKPFASSNLADVKVHENEVLLLSAKDRGVDYKPPVTHMGHAVEASTAREVALIALPHVEKLIQEAQAFDPPK